MYGPETYQYRTKSGGEEPMESANRKKKAVGEVERGEQA